MLDCAAPRRSLATVLVAVLAVAVSACGGGSDQPRAGAARAAGATLADVPAVVREVEPSVVTIFTSGGLGSGVVYRADGEIVTNEHVVSGHRQVEVAFADGRREPGTVQAADRATDIALVKVARRDLPAARFQPRLPQVGELAVVLGSPLGFEKTVTAGIISGLHREIPGSATETASLVDLLQTDAPISPGNSGGAVVDGRGEVVGISEAYIPPEQGAVAIGFAIPAATATRVADQLIATGRAQHAFLGIQPAQLTPQIARELGLAQSTGVLVYGVARGGPAADAGLRPGDVIVGLDQQRVETVEDFLGFLRQHRPGSTVDVKVLRGGQQQTFRVTLASTP